MGSISSRFVNRPSLYATSFVPGPSSIVTEDEIAKWKSYDYVIIGGGSAGCILASRLSEDPNTTVLVLEAGESHDGKFFSRIPLAFERMLGTPHDWCYRSTPQESLHGRTVEMPRGKLLGGTSSINAMIYQECHPEDFDSWERKGATGWGYEKMRPYFQKLFQDGPVVTDDLPLAPITHIFIEAAKTLGLPFSKGFSDIEAAVGVGAFRAAVDKKHERSSSATSYLNPAVQARPNLTIAVCAHTERILFTGTGETLKAVGVQISASREGPKFAVGAKREVLLSAGVIGSPQILLLSGVGPSEQLQKVQVPVVRDRPAVGRGLLDHFCPGTIVFRAKAGLTWDAITQSQAYSAWALLRWLAVGSGPMSALCGQAAVFVRSDDKSLPFGADLPVKDTMSGPTAPDLECLLFPMAIIDYGHGFPPPGNYGISVGAILLKPASEGTIELSTNSVYDPPLIDPRYLSDRSDVNAFIRAVRFLLRLVRTSPLSDALDLRNYENAPENADYYWIGDADPDKVSDEEIEAYIRKFGQSSAHPTSSARMGSNPAKSVVDAELRVHGIQSLRVIDTSVFPDQLSGHPCVPVMALAERAADLIKGVAHI